MRLALWLMARGMPNTAMDGCSGFSPDHHTASISNIQLVCGPWPSGQSVQKGESTRRRSQQKSCSNPTNRVAAAVFPQQKSTGSVLADPRVFPHLSRSPDLWIISIVRPSQISPMTGFRLAQHLPTYSGGTVRESHPVFYSPAALLPHPQALKRNIYLRKQYTRYCPKCQSKR